MHFVNRGLEPDRLKPIRLRYTPAWINYYQKGIGSRPVDKKWREFIDELGIPFSECCGYCEVRCKGVVDHYQPKSQFPQLVYEWANWVFSCHDCNESKGARWPSSGLLDPCSPATFCNKPGYCFAYDWKTGEVLPHPDLPRAARARAQITINALSLNLPFRLKIRLDHIRRLDILLKLAEHDSREAAEAFACLALPNAPLHSLTKYYLADHIYTS